MICGAFDERLTRTLPVTQRHSVSRQSCLPQAHLSRSPRTSSVREGILEVPGEVSLYHGGKLSGVRIAWRIAGPATAPAYVRWVASPQTDAFA